MSQKYSRSDKQYTFDTCIGIKMVENPNFASLLSCRLERENSLVRLTSQTELELTRKGYDFASVSARIHECLGMNIVHTSIDEDMRFVAKCLKITCPTLHNADSLILADSKLNGTTLVTCDRGLTTAADLVGVCVINPDVIATDTNAPNPTSRYTCIVRNEQSPTNTHVQDVLNTKIRSLISNSSIV